MTTKALHFKWTISRGRETYGYNICTLLVDGEKVARCNGGGYDMQGTCLADWLEKEFQAELRKLANDSGVNETTPARTYGTKGKDLTRVYDVPGFYGFMIYVTDHPVTAKARLDGGCGFSSMQRIAEAIGIQLKWNKESDKYRNHSFYTAIIE